jgi:hypothetical protein
MISWKANNKPIEGAITTKQMTAEEYQSISIVPLRFWSTLEPNGALPVKKWNCS